MHLIFSRAPCLSNILVKLFVYRIPGAGQWVIYLLHLSRILYPLYSCK